MTESTPPSRLGWLMDELVDRVAGARHAILLSADGLLMANSADLARADAEHLAAVGSAYRSLSHGTGRHFGLGAVRQTVVELDRAYLLVTEAGERACLALITHEDADLGLVGYEMNRVVHQARPHLASQPRSVNGAAADAVPWAS
ncbi:Predicted regulator of Ras-like GTPase activity, Roadblock/LC7/MglB family [Actinokineospora alba]|uniref:Predicted regulator of Ras-like GTPase activity, Roadblock/LC7/MglB family n=1 Tax=Actinokineospora alba TaxID=504798 RepID=A0A1H0LTQ5_9PSEU|nr:roadblock/LC7 domain-containing protein [Actinokineospora alba]TDP67451.1 putative regulator of Ras-like GTPase activity (Roadblock/LC7/MglB family) [Actinokineospora alba]SDI96241.1 Predicted regulator of Ras-like GTPase activity, Roadblock/LC7/MglB family [Actinokineospora alba]SDO71493.1 Predicted regulator of Ras-like GTPase activity, Roadblock/LC7/MglB family [Actinokineospora alba]